MTSEREGGIGRREREEREGRSGKWERESVHRQAQMQETSFLTEGIWFLSCLQLDTSPSNVVGVERLCCSFNLKNVKLFSLVCR